MNMKKLFLGLLACLAACVGPASAQTVIRPNQAIMIDIRGVPADEISRIKGDYTVSDSGTVNLPLIGPVGAAGLSPSALQSRIEAAYKSGQIYKNPTIMVIASSGEAIQKQLVHAGGQVRRTGPVEYVQGLTLYQAVQAAGGPTEFGAMNRVELLRGGKVRVFNLNSPQDMNFLLEQNDTITVPEKNWLGR